MAGGTHGSQLLIKSIIYNIIYIYMPIVNTL